MTLLSVFAHPVRNSYPGAVLDAFLEPFRAAGEEVDVLDPHQEGFDPRFTEDDHAHFWGAPVPPEIARMHRRVEAADRLAFVFPVYWWGMPALMKGWIERVFTGGWAYQYGCGVEDRGTTELTSLLRNVPPRPRHRGGGEHRRAGGGAADGTCCRRGLPEPRPHATRRQGGAPAAVLDHHLSRDLSRPA